MRRWLLFFLCLALAILPVYAAGSASELSESTKVQSDGTCEVELTLQLNLDTLPKELLFPVPLEAKDVSVNGRSVSPKNGEKARNVDLSKILGAAGSHSVTVAYSLPDRIVRDDKGALYLELQLLSGFSLSITSLSFSVILPGPVEYTPTFQSAYHPDDMDALVEVSVEENRLDCRLTQGVNDHETLYLRLQVPPEQFPQPIAKRWSLSTDDILMGVLMLLAFLYWRISMGGLPKIWRLRKSPSPPEGITAGDLGCCLQGGGTDFTMMVVSWAQLGYLRIQLEENGRVLLHKRMDMGNERSAFEIHYFRRLFGGRRTIDGYSAHYARLCLSARKEPSIHGLFRRGSGNPLIYRGLNTAAGVCAGVSMANALGGDTTFLTLSIVLFGFLAGLGSWLIQNAAYALAQRDRNDSLLALCCSVIWLLLGLSVGEPGIAAIAVAVQYLAGFCAAYGGRRTVPGRQLQEALLELRKFLKKASREELVELQRLNPDYFYRIAPYVVAFGLDRSLAERCRGIRLPGNSSILSASDGHMSPGQWFSLIRKSADSLDRRQRQSRTLRARLRRLQGNP